MRSLVMPLAASAVVALVAFWAACPAEDPCAAEEPAYGGEGNDEVWLTLRDRKADATDATDERDAPTITKPAAGDALPQETAPTFEWDSPLKIALGPHPLSPLSPLSPPSPLSPLSPLPPSPLFRPRAPSLLERAFTSLAELAVPKAHAHLAPVSSDAYLVDVLVPGRACPVSIVTTELSHTLDADTWALLQESAGEELTMQLTSAYLSSGNITEGPFKAADVTFTIQ